MKDDRIVKTEDEKIHDIDIRSVDTMMQPKKSFENDTNEKDIEDEISQNEDLEEESVEQKDQNIDEEVVVKETTESVELEEYSSNEDSNDSEIEGEVETEDEVQFFDENEESKVSYDFTEKVENYVEEVRVDDVENDDEKQQPQNKLKDTVKNVKNKFLYQEIGGRKQKRYIDYKVRVAFMGVLAVVFFGLYLVFFVNALAKPEEQSLTYTENSDLDYKVYLKANDFYEKEYLDKNMLYVASLIDNIAVDFKYRFSIREILDMDLSYNIIGKLIISDADGKKRYFEKEYELLQTKSVDLSKTTSHGLKETVLIDYDYYNGLANQFKMNYGVDTNSTLQLFLKINKNSNDSIYNINDDSVMSITIPLSTKSVEIEMNYNEINEKRNVVQQTPKLVHNKVYMGLSIVFGLALIIVAIKLIRFLNLTKTKKSVYDNYVERLLKEYDRLIVENFTGPDLKNSTVVTIKNFDELLDVRDGLRLPILYYVVAKHQKCYFYVKNDKEIYLMTVKAVDLEGGKYEKV